MLKMPMIWYSGSPKERVESITVKTAVRQPAQSDNIKRYHIYLPLIVLNFLGPKSIEFVWIYREKKYRFFLLLNFTILKPISKIRKEI